MALRVRVHAQYCARRSEHAHYWEKGPSKSVPLRPSLWAFTNQSFNEFYEMFPLSLQFSRETFDCVENACNDGQLMSYCIVTQLQLGLP